MKVFIEVYIDNRSVLVIVYKQEQTFIKNGQISSSAEWDSGEQYSQHFIFFVTNEWDK
jgi:hypothetical protein